MLGYSTLTQPTIAAGDRAQQMDRVSHNAWRATNRATQFHSCLSCAATLGQRPGVADAGTHSEMCVSIVSFEGTRFMAGHGGRQRNTL